MGEDEDDINQCNSIKNVFEYIRFLKETGIVLKVKNLIEVGKNIRYLISPF